LGSEEKTICRISPDATQILYLVPSMRRPV
jgi:hypothetical protein